jgi:hypothetical protein
LPLLPFFLSVLSSVLLRYLPNRLGFLLVSFLFSIEYDCRLRARIGNGMLIRIDIAEPGGMVALLIIIKVSVDSLSGY